MNYEDIKKIIADMEEFGLNELSIEFSDGTKINMKKGEDKASVKNNTAGADVGFRSVGNGSETSVKVNEETGAETVRVKTEEECYNAVKSPMVGTFYSSSSPEKEPFIKIGDHVKRGDTLCIIEAMKLMNEIESEFDGEIVEILVRNEQMVEYGQALFKIK